MCNLAKASQAKLHDISFCIQVAFIPNKLKFRVPKLGLQFRFHLSVGENLAVTAVEKSRW